MLATQCMRRWFAAVKRRRRARRVSKPLTSTGRHRLGRAPALSWLQGSWATIPGALRRTARRGAPRRAQSLARPLSKTQERRRAVGGMPLSKARQVRTKGMLQPEGGKPPAEKKLGAAARPGKGGQPLKGLARRGRLPGPLPSKASADPKEPRRAGRGRTKVSKIEGRTYNATVPPCSRSASVFRRWRRRPRTAAPRDPEF